MFIGHYAVAFAAKKVDRTIPLWVLFVAVQLLDIFWAPFILLGIEKARITPGFTASNQLDLYYMPYTHGLFTSLAWSAAAAAAYALLSRPRATRRAAAIVALAVFSHWLLDVLVHIPDMPVWDDTLKLGLGLWNYPAIELPLEIVMLFGAIRLYLRSNPVKPWPAWAVGVALVAMQVGSFLGPPPPSITVMATMTISAYALFTALALWVDRPDPARRMT